MDNLWDLMFLMPLSSVSFIDHLITTMFPDCKFLFKELEASGFIVCVGSSCLLCAFQSAFLENAEFFFFVINCNLSFKMIDWSTSSDWTVIPNSRSTSWLSVVNAIETCKGEPFPSLSCSIKQGPCFNFWYFLKHKSKLKNKKVKRVMCASGLFLF